MCSGKNRYFYAKFRIFVIFFYKIAVAGDVFRENLAGKAGSIAACQSVLDWRRERRVPQIPLEKEKLTSGKAIAANFTQT